MELIIVIGLLVVVGSWVYFGREARREAVNQAAKKSLALVDDTAKKSLGKLDEVAKKSIHEASKVTNTIAQTSQNVLEKARILKKVDGFDSFKQWMQEEQRVAQSASINIKETTTSFSKWFSEADTNDQKAFYERLARFAIDNRIKLQWITQDGFLPEHDEIKRSLEDVILLQSLVWHIVNTVQPKLELLETYELWHNEPEKGKNLEISQKLFAKMIEENMVTASPELLLAPEKKRREYVVQSVLDYLNKDRKAFLKMFNDVLQESKLTLQDVQEASESAIEGEVIESKPAQKRTNRRTTEEE